ncbi:MAG: hypothetical protein IH592_02680 [Bacteroidales bacterium]|nr:hypothetical protein [Bacteroidales bacterium]
MKHILFPLVLTALCHTAVSQSVLSPNYGLKAPLTAEIVRVDFGENATVVWLTIMSDINNAWFCIDRNTFLVRPDGVKLKLTGLKGLPFCPATYKFRRPGEKASFSLTFPATGMLPWFSVVEECMGGCLSFRGIVTDLALNNKLNEAYSLSDRGEDTAAYRLLEEILNETDSLNLGIEGSVYTSLILIDRRLGRTEAARSWYNRMMTSDTPDLGLYLETLRKEGVEF